MKLTVKDIILHESHTWCIRQGLMTVATGTFKEMTTLYNLIGDPRFMDKIHIHKDIFLQWGDVLFSSNSFAEYSLCLIYAKK